LAWLTSLVAGLLAAATLGCAAPADDAALHRHIRAALADAARRTGIDAADLKVTSAERVTWLDGSLGCPEPDLMYTQALVPGYRVRIEAGSETLDYHAGARGAPLLCPPERAVDPASERRSQRDDTAPFNALRSEEVDLTWSLLP
jgi:hypothetical protein